MSTPRYGECQVSLRDAADFGACLNVGDHRMSDLALALLDCRLAVDGRDPSDCVLSGDEHVLQCPERRAGASSYDVLDVLMELFDACRPKSLGFFENMSNLLSSELANRMKESISHHSKVREEFGKVLKQTNQLNLILQDNLIVTKTVLEQTELVADLGSGVQKSLAGVKESFTRKENIPIKAAKESISFRLSSLNLDIESFWKVHQNSANTKDIVRIDHKHFVKMLYCSICGCLFVYHLSQTFRFNSWTYLALTMLIGFQSLVSDQKPLHVILDLILGNFLLLVLLSVRRKNKKSRKETSARTQTSQLSI